VNMKLNMRNRARSTLLLAAAVIFALPLALEAAKAVPVTVTGAEPSAAVQGDVKTVKITGTGFDNGSKASFLVTGTTDASQIVVTTVRFKSSTELEADIQVQPNALTVSYDIAVVTSTGRKGKGTTLFKVQSASPPNPALAFTSGENVGVYSIESDGSDQTLLTGSKSFGAWALSWLPDGSGVVFTERTTSGRKESRSIQYVDRNGTNSSTVFTANGIADPYKAEWDTIEATVDGCGLSEAAQILFIDHSDVAIYSVELGNLSSFKEVAASANTNFSGIAVSKDGKVLATFTWPQGEGVSSLEGRLEIRDLCSAGAPVLWSWSLEQLGMPAVPPNVPWWIDTIDWSYDNRLAVTRANEDVWLIDPFPSAGPVVAIRLTGEGTGFGVGTIEQSVNWVPDGRSIVFVSHQTAGDGIYSIDVETGAVTFIGQRTARTLDWRDNWTPNP